MLENRELYNKLIQNVRSVLVIRQTAMLSGVTDRRLREWLDWGKRHLNDDPESPIIFAQFARDFYMAQAEKVSELMEEIREGKKNWQSSAWLLERCFRDDFGSDAAKLAEISDEIAELRAMFMKFKKPDDVYGDNPDGEKVDKESDQA